MRRFALLPERTRSGDPTMTLEHEPAAVSAGEPSVDAGLSTDEADEPRRRYGPNAVPEERPQPFLLFLRKLWSPVPWMLELTLVLQFTLGKYTDAIVIGALLLLNAVLGFVQENRAQKALALLRQRLIVQVRVRRDGRWQLRLAEELVPGDIVRLRVGDLVPADVRAVEGYIAVDRSALTGESVPVEIEPGNTIHAGALVKRGEITGEVTATGTRTVYGKTVDLVQTAKTASHLEALIVTIVKYLVALDTVLVAAVLTYALLTRISLTEVLPFALILLVASVPVALPATFTLAEALGSLDLAARGVLVTRLSAVEEAAAMDVLCSDKTGTITKNELTVGALYAEAPHTEDDVIRFAILACDGATQDPIDLAILRAARSRGLRVDLARRRHFLPFDPSTKRSEAIVEHDGGAIHVIKGMPAVITKLCPPGLETAGEVERMAAAGHRVIAVAAGTEGQVRMVGLIGLHDPPRGLRHADPPAARSGRTRTHGHRRYHRHRSGRRRPGRLGRAGLPERRVPSRTGRGVSRLRHLRWGLSRGQVPPRRGAAAGGAHRRNDRRRRK
jgi:H+-transporting ATPase